MKVPLSSQIEVSTILRDTFEIIAAKGGSTETQHTADVLNGIVLTLSLLQANEDDFRAYMKTRKGN